MKYTQRTPEERKAYLAQWRAKNREKLREQSLAWVHRQLEKDREGTLAKMRVQSKKSRENNLEKSKARSREYTRRRRKLLGAEYNLLQREYRKNNPEKFKVYYQKYRSRPNSKKLARQNNLKRLYGISQNDYEKMLICQEGKCAICGIVEENLFVDHDHETGKVRSLLCNKCNFLLGHIESGLKRTPEILNKVTEYLKKPKH